MLAKPERSTGRSSAESGHEKLLHEYELSLLVFLSHIMRKFISEVKKKYCMQSNAYKAILLLDLVTTTAEIPM